MKDFDLELLWKNSFDPETILSWMGFNIDFLGNSPEESINVLDKEWDLYIAANEVKHPFDDWDINRERKERFMKSLKAKYSILEPQPGHTAIKPQQIPPELATTEAKAYFDRAIELGLMDGNYRWHKGLQRLACFAREMSIRLNLGKGMKQVSWKPFETLFSIPTGKLRLNYNDIQKTGQQPSDSDLIDKVFE